MNHLKTWGKRLTQLLLYGGLEKEQYQLISPEIDESNRKSLIVLSAACALFYFVRLNLGYSRLPDMNRTTYLAAILLFGFIALGNGFCKNNRRFIHFTADLFLATYLGVGIISSIGPGSIQERTTLYLAFVAAAPMLFALNAVELSAVILPAECIYLAAIAKYQSMYPVYATNRGNSLFFSLSGLLLGIYTANMRISGIYSAYLNLRMEEIQQLNDELRQSREELRLALDAAEHANRAKTTFLNNMSHDIRTPMNAIIGFTSLAQSHIEHPEQVKDYLAKIMTSSQHLLSLINDVLDMSRIESGKVKIEEKPLHLPDILHDLRTIIQPSIHAKRQELSIGTEDIHNEDIIADKLRLNQILLNILSNAIKFTPPGGTISVKVVQKATAPAGFADFEFHIKDTGIGMSPEFLDHIFEAFTREETAAVNSIPGTGLGMAITKNIVDMMHGTITVESTVGKGTEFTVALRFAASSEAVTYAVIPQLQGVRALVADDDADACRSVSRMLRELGLQPEWTLSGKEAVLRTEDALDQHEEYSVYLIDWLMPDLNGVETVRRIRRMIGSDKPIIILTAYDWSDIEEEAREAGVTAFCSKPLFLSELQEVLGRPFRTAAEPPAKPLRPADLAGKKILLAEDNLLNQEIAVAILQENGFEVDTVGDGRAAVDRIRCSAPGQYDVILMDVQMPQMDGYEATRAIRALSDPAKANIPILAMTANAFEEDKRAALDAGMNGHLAKPIEIPKLLEALQQVFA